MALSEHDALIYLMVVAATADEAITDQEIERISVLVQRLPVFSTYDREEFAGVATECIGLMQGALGIDGVVQAACDALPERLRDTAYALAVEVAAVDFRLEQEELHVLETIAYQLNLDKLTIGAIEAAARARYRKP